MITQIEKHKKTIEDEMPNHIEPMGWNTWIGKL
jgi:hypothetical protein